MLRNARALVLLPLLAACNRTPEPDPTPVKTAAASTASASTTASAPRELAWTAPSGWTRAENTSAMRKATYKIPAQTGDTEQPELAISVAGGGIDANIDRWVQQFGEGAKATLDKRTRKIGEYEVTIVELKGTYQGNSMPGAPQTGPKTNYALLGAIVPVGPDARWFFKMIGPAKSVSAARTDFDALLGSLHAQ